MKFNLTQIKSHYSLQISQAKANHYEAILVPLELELDIYCFNNIEDKDYIFQIASDYGYDRFLLINCINNTEEIIDMFKLEAA